MKKFIWILSGLLLIAQFSLGVEKQFVFEGHMRTYIVHEPTTVKNGESLPVIFCLHGYGSSGAGIESFSALDQQADLTGFIAVYPNGLAYSTVQMWNAGSSYEAWTGGIDDVGFISALIDTMVANYSIDTTRIYVIGSSNGSFMAYRIAAELSHKVAAIGAQAGQMVYEYCNPKYPVPIIHIHGLSDTNVPYEGVNISGMVVPHTETVIAEWRAFNGCDLDADTIFNQNGILGRKWATLNHDGDIELYTIENWGHGWPRTTTCGISATETLVEFLLDQKKNYTTNSVKIDKNKLSTDFQIYPNSFSFSTTICITLQKEEHISLKIFDLTGQKVAVLVDGMRSSGEYKLTWQPGGLPDGMYFCRLETGGFSEIKKILLLK